VRGSVIIEVDGEGWSVAMPYSQLVSMSSARLLSQVFASCVADISSKTSGGCMAVCGSVCSGAPVGEESSSIDWIRGSIGYC
jgi:hypothetical protein